MGAVLYNVLLVSFGDLSGSPYFDFIYLYPTLFQSFLSKTMHTDTLYNMINLCLHPLNYPRFFFLALYHIFPDWEPLRVLLYYVSIFTDIVKLVFSSCGSVIFQVNLIYIYSVVRNNIKCFLPFWHSKESYHISLKDQGQLEDISQFLLSFSEAVLYCHYWISMWIAWSFIFWNSSEISALSYLVPGHRGHFRK